MSYTTDPTAGRAPHSLFARADTHTTARPGDGGQHFLSKEECRALADRIIAMADGGGETYVGTWSNWYGNLRWGRNQVNTGGDVESTSVSIGRTIRGASGWGQTNALVDDALRKTMREAETLRLWGMESPDTYPVAYHDREQVQHPLSNPKIWFDTTYNLNAERRAQLLEPIVADVSKLGLLTAGYVRVDAVGFSVIKDPSTKLFRYAPMTTAQFSLTVRDPRGTRSGWAGVDFGDWTRIDTAALARIAIDKCERSKNAVAIEPGRFTAILEPQALCDLFSPVMRFLDRAAAEGGRGPFADPSRPGFSKIGQRLLDPRITVSADPMDPDLGYLPFDWAGEPYINVNWFENGVLKELSYPRSYGVSELQKDWALPSSGAFRISGGTSTIDEMIATTERGVLVTRFHDVFVVDQNSILCRGITRDGFWLIEKGKISKAIKNFRFTESPLFILNNVDQLGAPQRVFHPEAPAVCPPVKVRDFSFTGLMDAV